MDREPVKRKSIVTEQNSSYGNRGSENENV
jgi:hypothetical protein